MGTGLSSLNIEALRGWVQDLRRAEGLPANGEPEPTETLEALLASLEELRPAVEDLRQQNEELTATRDALDKEYRRYRKLFDFAPDGYLVTDPNGVIQEANRAAAILLQEQQNRLAGKPVVRFVAPDDRQRLAALLAGAAEREHVQDREVRLAPRKGKPLPAAVTLAAVRDAQGQLTGLRWLIRDVSGRKHMVAAPPGTHDALEERVEACTAELRTSNEQLRSKITELERAEMAVEERLRFETLLSRLSTRFLNLPPGEVDRQIEHGLQRLAQFLEVDRSTLFEFSQDKTHLRATHSWTVAGCEPAPALIAFDQLPWATAKMLRGDIFLFSQVSDLPAEAARDKAYLRKRGPKSAVVIPLAVAGSITGAVSFASLGTERPWSDGVVQRLRLVGEIFSNALSRKQADESLHKAFSRRSRRSSSNSRPKTSIFAKRSRGSTTSTRSSGKAMSSNPSSSGSSRPPPPTPRSCFSVKPAWARNSSRGPFTS